MLCALQKSDTGTLKLTKQPKLIYKDQTKYGRYTTFSLSVPFLLSLRFLMLGDAMWLDIGVMPSTIQDLLVRPSSARRLRTWMWLGISYIMQSNPIGCIKWCNFILIWRGTNYFSRFWPLLAAVHIQTKLEAKVHDSCSESLGMQRHWLVLSAGYPKCLGQVHHQLSICL